MSKFPLNKAFFSISIFRVGGNLDKNRGSAIIGTLGCGVSSFLGSEHGQIP